MDNLHGILQSCGSQRCMPCMRYSHEVRAMLLLFPSNKKYVHVLTRDNRPAIIGSPSLSPDNIQPIRSWCNTQLRNSALQCKPVHMNTACLANDKHKLADIHHLCPYVTYM